MYEIITANTLENLEKRCENKVKNGFEPKGGVVELSEYPHRYCQVMYKKENLIKG